MVLTKEDDTPHLGCVVSRGGVVSKIVQKEGSIG